MIEFILVGNPNVGKTTLFNTLTKSNKHVGNWHGITVSVVSKKFEVFGVQCLLHDLPGIYSLNAYSDEEKEACKFLANNKNCTIINICDAHNLSRNLLLTHELKSAGHKVILAVNMALEVKGINYNLLASRLGVCVVPIDARKKRGCSELLEILKRPEYQIDTNQKTAKSNQKSVKNASKKQTLDNFYKLQPNNIDLNVAKISDEYAQIDKILYGVMPKQNKPYGISKLDKIFYNKFLYLPIFLCVMLLVFVITFGGVGQMLSYIVETIFGHFADLVSNILCKINVAEWAYGLVMQGVVGGVGVVVSFLPQIVLLMLCINFLEDVGYLSRVAFMLNGSLKKFGLTGKSVLSLLLGYGCTTTALLTTRGLDNQDYRKRTALLLPYASCSAKLPVYAIICSAFFASHKALIVFGLYLLGVVLGLIVTIISVKISKSKSAEFVMEVPPLRLPTVSRTLKNMLSSSWSFIKRVGGTLVACSVVVWLLTNVSFGFKFVPGGDGSILQGVAKFIAPIFAPIGLNSWGVVVALLIGMVAKEMVVSCLSITNGVVGSLSELAASLTLASSVVSFTPASAASFLVFILLYSPCISALSVASKELGRGFAIKIFLLQFVVAYLCAMATYWLVKLGSLSVILIVGLAIVLFAVIKLNQKVGGKSKFLGCSSCNGTCSKCR